MKRSNLSIFIQYIKKHITDKKPCGNKMNVDFIDLFDIDSDQPGSGLR